MEGDLGGDDFDLGQTGEKSCGIAVLTLLGGGRPRCCRTCDHATSRAVSESCNSCVHHALTEFVQEV